MHTSRLAAAAGALVLAGTTAAVVATSGPSDAASHKPRTISFTSITLKQSSPTQTDFLAADVDKSAGKVVGYDTISGVYDPKTDSVSIDVAVSLAGGQIFAHFSDYGDGGGTGKVTGGTGSYQGATGTVTGKDLDKNGDRTAVTITLK